MNEAAAKLSSRVVRWVIAFSAATTLLFVSLIPELLLLGDPVASEAADRELMLLAAAGTAALVVVAARLRRHRYLLRALALGSRSVEPFELEELGR
jgi:hypothetical protein